MKRYLLLLLALCLLLSGCAGVQVPDNTTTLPDGTTQSTEATTVPEETTLPDETTVPQETTLPPVVQPLAGEYAYDSQWAENFVYTKDFLDSWRYDLIGEELKSCREGALYRLHKDTGALVTIVDAPIAEYCYIGEGYFYILESDKRSVMWTDRMGEEHVLIYTAQNGDVTQINYNGFFDEGNLYTLEGNACIVQTSYPTGESNVFFTQDGITTFFLHGYPEPEQFYFFKGYHEFWVDLETGKITESKHL